MSDRVLSLEGVSHSFGPKSVLHDIDLDVRRGEFLAVVGPSGCGKTTLLNLISGFYNPTVGKVSHSISMRMVYQHDGLFPWLTAAENISLGLRHVTNGESRLQQINDLLTLTRLRGFSDHFPHQLSGGMRRRVELARVLAAEADLLLLDEPFSALDYQTRLRMRYEFVQVLNVRQCTVVLVTHDIEEAAHLADRILVLSDPPTHISYELRINLARPREMTDPQVMAAVESILRQLEIQEGCRASDESLRDSREKSCASWWSRFRRHSS